MPLDPNSLVKRVSFRELLPDVKTWGDLLLRGHGAGYAMTESGKSTLERELLVRATDCRRVWWNVAQHPLPGSRTARSAAELRRQLLDGARLVNFPAPRSFEAAVERMEDVAGVLFELGESVRMANGGDQAPKWLNFTIDEVDSVAPMGQTSGPMHELYGRIAKEGVTVWGWTPDPAKVASVVPDQAIVHVLMLVKAKRVPYLERVGLPMEQLWEHVAKPYHSALIVKNQFTLLQPISA